MNTTSNSDRNGAASRLVAVAAMVFGLVAGVLGLVVTAAPAAQAAPGPTQYGYMDVRDKSAYMGYYRSRLVEVLHIDEEHADANGFWFAAKSSGGRGLTWNYQPYGQWCSGNPNMKVDWNGWLNAYTCVVRVENAAIDHPEWAPRTETCRQESGYPWKQAAFTTGVQCTDVVLDRRYNPLTQSSPTIVDVCAPWEDQGLEASGAPKCASQTYPWQSNTPNSEQVYWTAAPDTCTQMPADTNTRTPGYDPSLYAPVSGGDGTCTGEAFAPNCATAPERIRTTARACTGVEEEQPVIYTATASATKTSTTNVYVTRSHTATAKGSRYTKTVRVTLKHKGRRYSGKGTYRVMRSATRTVTMTGQFTGQGTATVTKTCSSLVSQAEADTCALDSANAAAETAALADATKSARDLGIVRLNAQVIDESRSAARRALAAIKVSTATKRIADKRARALAVKDARRKFRR